MKKKVKTALLIGGSAVVAATVATIAASRVLVSVAVKRKIVQFPTKMQDKLTGGLMSDPNSQAVIKASREAELLPTERVDISGHDGVELTGRIYHAKNPKRIIVAMHGWRSSWNVDFGSTAPFYHQNDCTIIFPDQRAQNGSGGDYIGFGVLERHDCLLWVKYAVERFGNDIPIYLCGVSMGATTVLMTTGFQLPQNLKGVIADCGFTSPHDIWEHVLKNNLHLNSKITYPIANYICKKEAKFDGEEYSTVEALQHNEIPVLLIHGSSDRFVPIEMTFNNYLAAKGKKELLIVPGAGHGMSYITDSKSYEKAVKGFFEKCEILGFED